MNTEETKAEIQSRVEVIALLTQQRDLLAETRVSFKEISSLLVDVRRKLAELETRIEELEESGVKVTPRRSYSN